jgi:hypothetical protein
MSYFAKLGLDVSEFMGGLSKSSQGLLAFARDVTVTMNMTMQIFEKVIQSVQKFGQIANELRDLSYTTGVTTDQLQRMQYAAILSGTSFYTVTTSLQKLTLSMDEAKKAGSAAADAFARLSVDPTGKPVEQVFNETALALFQMKRETVRLLMDNPKFMEAFKESYMKHLDDAEVESFIKALDVLSPEEMVTVKAGILSA